MQTVFTPAMNLFRVQLQPAQRRSLSIRPRSSSLVTVPDMGQCAESCWHENYTKHESAQNKRFGKTSEERKCCNRRHDAEAKKTYKPTRQMQKKEESCNARNTQTPKKQPQERNSANSLHRWKVCQVTTGTGLYKSLAW